MGTLQKGEAPSRGVYPRIAGDTKTRLAYRPTIRHRVTFPSVGFSVSLWFAMAAQVNSSIRRDSAA